METALLVMWVFNIMSLGAIIGAWGKSKSNTHHGWSDLIGWVFSFVLMLWLSISIA